MLTQNAVRNAMAAGLWPDSLGACRVSLNWINGKLLSLCSSEW